ncbi:MAG: hypothetical protein WC326_08215 [Candidatus Delongbacteria bacterium]
MHIIQERIEELRKLPIKEARERLALHCGDIDSPMYNKCLAFMNTREAEINDQNQVEVLSIAKRGVEISEMATRQAVTANKIALFAVLISVIAVVASVVVR